MMQQETDGQQPASDPMLSEGRKLAERFYTLFRGSERSHGKFVIDIKQDGVKRTGKASTSDGPVQVCDWESHLAGNVGLGVVPLLDDGTCVWGAIDIDVYEGLDSAQIAVTLSRLGLPLIPCRSKSGGLHVLLFAREAVPAALMVARLREAAVALGFASAEVFPKQVAPTESGGNWLNVPYFGGDATNRYAINASGDAISAEDFLEYAEGRKVSASFFEANQTGTAPKAERKKAFTIPDEIGEGGRDITLTRIAGKMRRDNFSEDAILAALRQVNLEKCKPPLDDSDVVRIARSIGRKAPAPVDEDAGLTKGLADCITASDSFARDKGALLYHFEEGVYRPTGQRYVERKVKELCTAWDRTKAWSPELATRVGQWLLVDAAELWETPPLDVLNVRNGLLDVATRALRPHSPEHLSPVQIAVSFNPEARCPHIDKFVADVFPEDTRHLSDEIAAWLMLPDTSIQKAVLLLGEGANGKSVWLNLLLTFLGRDNVATISLHRLESDKFSVARLVGKLANVGTDLPTAALTGTSMLKALTGGDVITAERKYESSFEFRPFARMLFSANSAPRSEDATHGFFRRWLVIPFNRTFDESDPETVPRAILDARLSQPGELSGLLNRALDAVPRVRAGRFTESNSTKVALEEFRATTDPMAVWLDGATVDNPDAFVLKERLRSVYAQVCQDAGRPIMADSQFTAALKRLRPRIEPMRRRVDGRQTQVFVGLGFVSGDQAPKDLF